MPRVLGFTAVKATVDLLGPTTARMLHRVLHRIVHGTVFYAAVFVAAYIVVEYSVAA